MTSPLRCMTAEDAMAETAFGFAGHRLIADVAGALWWPAERMLVVADLHLEKGSFFASRGQMLPPYDSLVTLDRLQALVRRRDPRRIVLLGDSFHDSAGADRLPDRCRDGLEALARGHDLLWIAGNHDPSLPETLPGVRLPALAAGGIRLVHEPCSADTPEIVGHFHPVAKVGSPRGTLRRRCFYSDGRRLILPAFGSLTGGLNVRDQAIARHVAGDQRIAYVLGTSRVFPVREARLLPDRA